MMSREREKKDTGKCVKKYSSRVTAEHRRRLYCFKSVPVPLFFCCGIILRCRRPFHVSIGLNEASCPRGLDQMLEPHFVPNMCFSDSISIFIRFLFLSSILTGYRKSTLRGALCQCRPATYSRSLCTRKKYTWYVA